MANIGTGVMAGHGMMSVAEEGFAIFGRYAGRTQTTSKGVPHVMDPDASQANFSASKLPCGVIHGSNPSAAIREHPDRIDSTLRLHDRPCSIVQDDDVGAFGLERFGGMTKTLRPTSGTGTSQVHSGPHTLLSRRPVFTAKSTMRPRCAGGFGKSRSCSSQVMG